MSDEGLPLKFQPGSVPLGIPKRVRPIGEPDEVGALRDEAEEAWLSFSLFLPLEDMPPQPRTMSSWARAEALAASGLPESHYKQIPERILTAVRRLRDADRALGRAEGRAERAARPQGEPGEVKAARDQLDDAVRYFLHTGKYNWSHYEAARDAFARAIRSGEPK